MNASQKRYPPELKERAVRIVRETITREGEGFGVITRIARRLGIGAESLRTWVRHGKQATKPPAHAGRLSRAVHTV